MNKKILIPTLGIAALAGVSILGVSVAKANDTNLYPPFVEKLSEKFGLNQDEVKGFFDEQRQEHQQVMQQSREEALDQAITDGVITEEQKQALQDKWEEKMTERSQHREEMQAWFEEQGLDPQALREYGGFGKRGFGRMHKFAK